MATEQIRLPIPAMKAYAARLVEDLRRTQTNPYALDSLNIAFPAHHFRPDRFAHEGEVLRAAFIIRELASDMVEVLGLTQEQKRALWYLGARLEGYREQRLKELDPLRLSAARRRSLWARIAVPPRDVVGVGFRSHPNARAWHPMQMTSESGIAIVTGPFANVSRAPQTNSAEYGVFSRSPWNTSPARSHNIRRDPNARRSRVRRRPRRDLTRHASEEHKPHVTRTPDAAGGDIPIAIPPMLGGPRRPVVAIGRDLDAVVVACDRAPVDAPGVPLDLRGDRRIAEQWERERDA